MGAGRGAESGSLAVDVRNLPSSTHVFLRLRA